ncbi:securin-like [Heterocephalus glaber]|uniref:Securin n=1 Tax=Heterocephalus glaber TaxID=10181 RepID=A0AAX6SGU8_HETGA|nr:securin-like [Heterocephalus glaber]
MATLIFVDKENGEPVAPVAPKDGLKLESGAAVKALDGRSRVSMSQVGKLFNAPPALPKTARKALGTVNRATEKSVKSNGPLKQNPNLSAKKRTEKTIKVQSSVPASDDTFPEIEKFFPFSPLDFESVCLPEQDQIAQPPLSGVPLTVLEEERGLERLPQLGPLHP